MTPPLVMLCRRPVSVENSGLERVDVLAAGVEGSGESTDPSKAAQQIQTGAGIALRWRGCKRE